MADFQRQAARPKGERAIGDPPAQSPMRQRGPEPTRNPTPSDKKVRRANQRRTAAVDFGTPGTGFNPARNSSEREFEQCKDCQGTRKGYYGESCGRCGGSGEVRVKAAKTATILDTRAEMLNPGDAIRTPNGQTMKVHRIRPHENSGKHVYVDTDGGTTLVKRTDAFQVVPRNSQQQSLPGYGTPGGNSNKLPFDPRASNPGNAQSTTQCPVCSTKGSLARSGDHYSCQRCGYREQFGGAGGHSFSDSKTITRTFSTINAPLLSAVARRAQQVLNPEENS